MRQIMIFPNAAALAEDAARQIVELARQSIRERGRFTFVLSGGSTPKTLFSMLAAEPYRSQIDWGKIEFFWGDERSVPPDHPDSNYRMANEAMLSKVPVPAGHIHRMRGELEPGEAAQEYARELLAFSSGKPLHFDCILLGLGPDAHTASLFPASEALKVKEATVVANWVEKFQTWRITMTAPLINQARCVMFLAAGDEKAAPLHEVLQGTRQPEVYPAQLIAPQGDLLWEVDVAAGRLLAPPGVN